MARLTGRIVSTDDIFVADCGSLLRSGAVPVSLVHGNGSGDKQAVPDLVVVDGRIDPGYAVSRVEELRSGAPASVIFMVMAEATPDLILQSMRAGANEFLTWPAEPRLVDEAVRRAAARRSAQPGGGAHAAVHVFIGAKGGMGTTTVAVNCGVEMALLDKGSIVLVDLKAGLGEVALFAGVRNAYGIVDAIDNLHRLDIEFLRELLVRHKTGLEILAGSEHFERPAPADASAVEEIFRLLGQRYDHILVDAGCQVNACVVPILYGADTIFLIVTPDVPSVRNAQRMLERIRKLGPCSERVRVILNRASAVNPIPLAQIEGALGSPVYQSFPSDYRTVASAANSGTPLSLAGKSELAKRFAQFTRRILEPAGEAAAAAGGKRLLFGRLASFW